MVATPWLGLVSRFVCWAEIAVAPLLAIPATS